MVYLLPRLLREFRSSGEAAWRESERRHNEKRRRENRALWVAYHLQTAACLEATARELAAEHRAMARALQVASDGEGEGVTVA
jgi:hypothetical protein